MVLKRQYKHALGDAFRPSSIEPPASSLQNPTRNKLGSRNNYNFPSINDLIFSTRNKTGGVGKNKSEDFANGLAQRPLPLSSAEHLALPCPSKPAFPGEGGSIEPPASSPQNLIATAGRAPVAPARGAREKERVSAYFTFVDHQCRRSPHPSSASFASIPRSIPPPSAGASPMRSSHRIAILSRDVKPAARNKIECCFPGRHNLAPHARHAKNPILGN